MRLLSRCALVSPLDQSLILRAVACWKRHSGSVLDVAAAANSRLFWAARRILYSTVSSVCQAQFGQQ